MPNYVYRGTECPHQFEVYQSFSEDPLTECTECGMPVRRVFQPTGLVFKGSGWYITDSRKSATNDASNGAAESSTTDSASKKATSEATSSAESTSRTEPAAAAKD